MSRLLKQAQEKLDAKARANSPDAPRDHGVILTCASTITPVPILWLWQHWLARGKVHMLAGAPGQGKTTIALAMAATVSCGGRWPDGSRCEEGRVLIWSGEDDPSDTLTPRLMAMGADRSRIFFITAARIDEEEVAFDPARDMMQLLDTVRSIGGVSLIVIDPIVSAVTGDSHKNTEVRRGMQPLVDVAAALHAAVLGISHLSKGTAGRDPTERVTGSVAFTAVVRVVLLAAKVKAEDGNDSRILVRSKSNIGPDDGGFEYHIEQTEAAPGIPASVVTWGKSVDGSARELLAEAEAEPGPGDEQQATSNDADDALRRILSADVMPRAAVLASMKAEGFSEKQVRSARERISVIVKRSGFGSELKTYWKLPDAVRPTIDEIAAEAIHAHSCPVVPTIVVGRNGHECQNPGMSDEETEVL